MEEDDLRWLVEDEWLSIGRIGGGGGEQMLSGSGGGGGGGGTSPEGLFSVVLPLCTLLLDRREAFGENNFQRIGEKEANINRKLQNMATAAAVGTYLAIPIPCFVSQSTPGAVVQIFNLHHH